MQKSILTYGTIAGLIVSSMFFLIFSDLVKDMNTGMIIGYTSMIIAFSTIFVATKNHRNNVLDGHITFMEALKIGLGITLVATVIYVIFWLILSNTIAKDFMADYSLQAIEDLKSSGLGEPELSEKIKEIKDFEESYKNPIVKIGMTFLEIFPVGLIISLISAALLKKN